MKGKDFYPLNQIVLADTKQSITEIAARQTHNHILGSSSVFEPSDFLVWPADAATILQAEAETRQLKFSLSTTGFWK